MEGASSKPAAKHHRLGRDDFLARALEVLSREGESELRIDRLVRALGVTKGSFYWHFENRADFVHTLAVYWEQWSTNRVVEELGDATSDPKTVLLKIHEIVGRDDLVRYELVMRAWATHEPDVARIVESVDRTRFDFVRRQFRRLGYRGRELDIRARAFVVTTSLWSVINRDESQKLRLKRLGAVLEILTRD
jgi:AcrR family transcriptional regulator